MMSSTLQHPSHKRRTLILRAALNAIAIASFVGLIGASHVAPSAAASFDCAKVQQPLDKIICATPELSAKDEQLAAKYNAAMALLSPTGHDILRQGQRKWLTFVRTHCTAQIGQPADPPGRDAAQCLEREYDERLNQLDSAAVKAGGFIFSRVDDFQLSPGSTNEDGGQRGHFGYCVIGYPRIDAPLSSEAKTWNGTWRKWAGTCAQESHDEAVNADLDITFDLGLAQNHFIHVSASAYGLFHGAGQPYISQSAQWNLILPTLDKLKADDLFKSGSGGQQLIIDRCLAALSRNLPAKWLPPDPGWGSACLYPDNWRITSEYLMVAIDLSEDYFAGVAEADIPWKELKPFLAPDAPIKLPGN
ncbi:MAG TPA: lysozyme inhibitor LprI family protein [Dongiaceae bacterium]